MTLSIEKARLEDVGQLLQLYASEYGQSYPFPMGTDPRAMSEAISSRNHLWLVTRDLDKGLVVGSVVFDLDPPNKIGKLIGVVVHSEYRRRNIALNMIIRGTKELLQEAGSFNSIYSTTRTVSVGPQLMCLKDDFMPLGIFPNAHKLREFETLSLLAKFKPGILERCSPPPPVPEKLVPLLKVFYKFVGREYTPEIAPPVCIKPRSVEEELEFELMFAPNYVRKRFVERFSDPYDRFYPFHTPNLLIASTNGEVEIYAYFSKTDRYCTFVCLTRPLFEFVGRLDALIHQLEDFGVAYIETLVGLRNTPSIETLLYEQFLPSAFYPAMQEINGKLYDFVLMSRTMEPLNFKGMEVALCLKPYIDQYLDLWKKMHLDSLEVFSE